MVEITVKALDSASAMEEIQKAWSRGFDNFD